VIVDKAIYCDGVRETVSGDISTARLRGGSPAILERFPSSSSRRSSATSSAAGSGGVDTLTSRFGRRQRLAMMRIMAVRTYPSGSSLRLIALHRRPVRVSADLVKCGHDPAPSLRSSEVTTFVISTTR
jgi:hypothetical protein